MGEQRFHRTQAFFATVKGVLTSFLSRENATVPAPATFGVAAFQPWQVHYHSGGDQVPKCWSAEPSFGCLRAIPLTALRDMSQVSSRTRTCGSVRPDCGYELSAAKVPVSHANGAGFYFTMKGLYAAVLSLGSVRLPSAFCPVQVTHAETLGLASICRSLSGDAPGRTPLLRVTQAAARRWSRPADLSR